MSLENDLEALEKEYQRLDKKYKDKISGVDRAIKIIAGIILIICAIKAIDLFFSTSLMDLIPEIAKFLLIPIIVTIAIYYVASLASIDIKRIRVRAKAENRIKDEIEKK